MKRLLTIMIFLVNYQLYAYDIKIMTSSYDNYNFNIYDGGYSDTSITILGWSRDGKILYESLFYGEQDFYIIDLIEDTIVWNASKELWETEQKFIQYDIEDIKKYITTIARRFNIEPVVSNIGKFPYKNNVNEYYCQSSEDRQPDPELNWFEIDIFVKQKFQPYKTKKINTIKEISGSWQHNNISDNLIYWYAKSPFENRIAVLIGIPQTHAEWDFVYYDYEIFDCHLSIGF